MGLFSSNKDIKHKTFQRENGLKSALKISLCSLPSCKIGEPLFKFKGVLVRFLLWKVR